MEWLKLTFLYAFPKEISTFVKEFKSHNVMLGGKEWLVILVVVLLLFGGKKIPELMRGLGKGVKEFKDAQKGEEPKTEDTTTEK